MRSLGGCKVLISDIEQDPIAALKYMERVVNDGPPSGLKFTNNVILGYAIELILIWLYVLRML